MSKIILGIFILSFGFYINTQAQVTTFEEVSNKKSQLAKHTFYGNIGFVGLGAGIGGNYEYTFYRSDKKSLINTINARIGIGKWGVWGDEGSILLTGITTTTSKRNHHIEGMLGVATTYKLNSYQQAKDNATNFGEPQPDIQNYIDILPAVTLGYRYQKPTGGFLWKAGVGTPEGLYLGVGFSF